MKYLITILLLLIALPVSARGLVGYEYEIVSESEDATTVSVAGFPNDADCKGVKTVSCDYKDAWRIESRELWDKCKKGEDISDVTDFLDCSQKTYDNFLDMRVKEKKDAIIAKVERVDKIDSLLETNEALKTRLDTLESQLTDSRVKLGGTTNWFQNLINWLINIFK